MSDTFLLIYSDGDNFFQELYDRRISSSELRQRWESHNMHIVSSEADIQRCLLLFYFCSFFLLNTGQMGNPTRVLFGPIIFPIL